MILAWLLLLTGLTLSAVAIYYSVVGLTAIFSAAVIPIIVMGTSLEVAKLVCASWLKANWERAPRYMKYYMIIAVAILMLITSMGIFGFLSKAHNDQNLVSGDVQSRIAIYDEKIKTAKENIESNRKQLKQMDEAVDQVMARSQDEKGADKANAIRKSQSRDRVALAKDIEANQKIVVQLNDEAAPIRAEVRKVEAEVGPIKYIAKFIYGEKGADENMLERAVTWIIVLIVKVFDPLAVIMLLGAQMTFAWARQEKQSGKVLMGPDGLITGFTPTSTEPKPEPVVKQEAVDQHDHKHDDPIECNKCGTVLVDAPGIGLYCPNKNCDVLDGWGIPEEESTPITVNWPFPSAEPNKEIEDRLWAESVANVPTHNYPTAVEEPKPKKERKPRKKKQTEEKENEPKSEEAITPKETTADETIQDTVTIKDAVQAPKAKKIRPARDLAKERKQAEILEAIIESTSAPSIVSASGTIGDSPIGTIMPPADNVPAKTGTVGAPLPGDEYYNKTDVDVKYQEEELKPTPRRSEAGGWFPNTKK